MNKKFSAGKRQQCDIGDVFSDVEEEVEDNELIAVRSRSIAAAEEAEDATSNPLNAEFDFASFERGHHARPQILNQGGYNPHL